jgi:hypothetical protein
MSFQRLRRAAIRLFRTTAPPPQRQRDGQRSRLYRWEAAAVLPRANRRLSLEECADLVMRVFAWAEAPQSKASWRPPRVTDGRGRRHACGSREIIKLPVWARTPAIVLHECAHGLAHDQHGPEFLGVYIILLERFSSLDAATLTTTARAAGLRVADPDQSSAVATLKARPTSPVPPAHPAR